MNKDNTQFDIDVLENNLRGLPAGTEAYDKAKRAMENALKENPKYVNEFVACILTRNSEFPYGVTAVDETLLTNLSELFYQAGGKFKNNISPAHFIPRYEAEYDITRKQLVVCTYITDGKYAILLKNKDTGRLANRVTMVQGHVNFSRDIYFLDGMEYLRRSANRELNEEIKMNFDDMLAVNLPHTPKYIVQTNSNFIDMEHIGIVYAIEVEDAMGLSRRIKSGEPDKHDIIVGSFEEILNEPNMCNWSRPVIEKEKEYYNRILGE